MTAVLGGRWEITFIILEIRHSGELFGTQSHRNKLSDLSLGNGRRNYTEKNCYLH